MLSYQHIYHAGSLADVHKHSILSVLISFLVKNQNTNSGKSIIEFELSSNTHKPNQYSQNINNENSISYIETHAGRGLYNLNSREAKKNKEFLNGIELIIKKNIFPFHHPYRKVIREVRKKYGKNFYPGSPLIAQSLINQNMLHLMELHPGEIIHLRNNIPKAKIYFQNGYDGIMSIPPSELKKTGIVLIDPSYELKDEYTKMSEYIINITQKIPEYTIVLWYPILIYNYHEKMISDILALKFNSCFKSEIFFHQSRINRMIGSGVLIINSPSKEISKIISITSKLNNLI